MCQKHSRKTVWKISRACRKINKTMGNPQKNESVPFADPKKKERKEGIASGSGRWLVGVWRLTPLWVFVFILV